MILGSFFLPHGVLEIHTREFFFISQSISVLAGQAFESPSCVQELLQFLQACMLLEVYMHRLVQWLAWKQLNIALALPITPDLLMIRHGWSYFGSISLRSCVILRAINWVVSSRKCFCFS